jgi:molybdopterin/thiamine biosynthesis adenylyltransferase
MKSRQLILQRHLSLRGGGPRPPRAKNAATGPETGHARRVRRPAAQRGAVVLTAAELDRYSRHILLSQVGVAGQRKLTESGALVIGAGGLGSAALAYLAAAGVGRLGIIDGDRVELSNLNRQVLHASASVGRPKVESAREAVEALNPGCEVTVVGRRLSGETIRGAVRGWDVVLDCTDNFPTRFIVSDACWLENRPLVTAAVLGFEGQLLTVLPGGVSPCYRCLIPEPPADRFTVTCGQAGVLGPAVGVMGTLQAVEAVKVLLGIGYGFERRLLAYDALKGRFRVIDRVADPVCALCGPEAAITDVVEYRVTCCPGGVCGPDGCCTPAEPPPKSRKKPARKRGRKGR